MRRYLSFRDNCETFELFAIVGYERVKTAAGRTVKIGRSVDIDELCDIARRYNIEVVPGDDDG